MPCYALDGVAPEVDETGVWIAPNAQVMGKVILGKSSSVWFGSVLRGDIEPIRVGAYTNVQDGSVLHTDTGLPLVLGDSCTIGHMAIVHGCQIEDRVLVGMGATVMNGVALAKDTIVGAGALVTEGKSFPPRSLIVGAPARLVRELNDEEVASIVHSAKRYAKNAQRYLDGLTPLDPLAPRPSRP